MSYYEQPGLIPNPRPTVAVVHASVGSGHKVAAEAIVQALEQMRETLAQRYPAFPSDMAVELFDILDFGRIKFDGNKTASSFTGWTRPYYDITWRYWLTGRLLWAGGTIWSHLMFPRFTRWVRENRPAAIITTHITAANCAVGARMITRQNFPVICVPTDYEVEGMWPHLYADLYCVATESMAETLLARKVPEENIIITGIPARAEFRVGYDRDEVRKHWNIPVDKTIALVLAGATLSQPYVRFREILKSALPGLATQENLHLVILTGRDDDYRARLEALFASENINNAIAVGYTEDVARLMAASDFMICKPGGLTVTECLCTETPMLLVGRAYGQEKTNARMLTSLGAALHVQTARELNATVRYLSAVPGALAAMRSTEEYLRRPDAAMQIAAASLQSAFGSANLGWSQGGQSQTTGSNTGALCSNAADAAREARNKRHSKRPFVSFYWGKQPAHTR
jgi:processive 1,2-diacylglycerol beta-glucosyltransferase